VFIVFIFMYIDAYCYMDLTALDQVRLVAADEDNHQHPIPLSANTTCACLCATRQFLPTERNEEVGAIATYVITSYLVLPRRFFVHAQQTHHLRCRVVPEVGRRQAETLELHIIQILIAAMPLLRLLARLQTGQRLSFLDGSNNDALQQGRCLQDAARYVAGDVQTFGIDNVADGILNCVPRGRRRIGGNFVKEVLAGHLAYGPICSDSLEII